MNHHLRKLKKHTKNLFRGLSLRRDEYFVRNLTVGVGVIMTWVGVWGILEVYLASYGVRGRVVCILVGILLLYLVDGDIGQLGGKSKKDEE